jgi:hypothetical protein
MKVTEQGVFHLQLLAAQHLRQAISSVRGSKALQAYPAGLDWPSCRLMGLRTTFDDAGFNLLVMPAVGSTPCA